MVILLAVVCGAVVSLLNLYNSVVGFCFIFLYSFFFSQTNLHEGHLFHARHTADKQLYTPVSDGERIGQLGPVKTRSSIGLIWMKSRTEKVAVAVSGAICNSRKMKNRNRKNLNKLTQGISNEWSNYYGLFRGHIDYLFKEAAKWKKSYDLSVILLKVLSSQ